MLFNKIEQIWTKEWCTRLGDVNGFIYDNIRKDWETYAKYVYNLQNTEQYLEKLEEIFNNYTEEEILEYLNVWTNMWIKHYRERVRIVWDEELFNKQQKQVTELLTKGRQKLSIQQIMDLMEPVLLALIKHGEIVCTHLLAKQIVLQELGKEKKDVTTLQDKLNVLNRALYRVRLISCTSGPLLFIKAKDILQGTI
jgi:hypothetical protein